MIGEICAGMAGAALFAAAFIVGRISRRRGDKPGGRDTGKAAKADGGEAARRLRELVNFLNYDGGEMPDGADTAEGGSK